MNYEKVLVLNLDQYIEGRRRFSLEHRLLSPTAPGFFIGQRDRLNAADQVGKGGIQHQVLECVSVNRRDELNTPFGDSASGEGLLGRAYLVDYDHFGHVILDSFDHDGVLELWFRYLHSARAPDACVRNV